ncbi:purine transporter [Dothidotthia symphoricarpi CBS 119687]|uniref:Purine transporter n=1 Tax=Dothidotthia symphoricarpi CBS 119687 TaxID=1392245 RepID=A0A6A5ZYV8_9PLEO|nr:purine transporter [Dothidotthia symphoricarpi CBS 119687]KAF2124063.1 purine transporter [Dothidotthia symphoricarpi CBS 119687]
MGFSERWRARLNDIVSQSPVGRYFHLEGSGHPNEIRGARFTTEMRAGLTTFFTMAYIIAVNASVLTDSGATCVCDDPVDPTCSTNEAYSLCLIEVNRDLVTATAAISAIGSFLMGLLANLPVAVAPAMGLNAYLAYQIVGYHGTGPINFRLAMMAVFVEGFIFVALSLFGIRQWLARIIPASIKIACGAGIGLFLTLIGLSYSAGIGAITGSKATPLELGGCPVEYLDPDTGSCVSHKATSPTMWLGFLIGGVFTSILMTYKIRGSMIVGIALVSIFSWPRDTHVTYFPRTTLGDNRFEFFKNVVAFHPIKNVLAVQDWNLSTVDGNIGQFVLAVFTMLYVDLLDATGTLYSMARFSGVVDPDTGDFPRSTIAYCADAVAISIGSLFGSSPVTAFVESGAGIQEGGRTGLTAMTTGICFFISLFFAPVFASIPPWATGGALVLVGCMMMRGITAINWNYPGDAIPAFVTVMFMPFSYSIAYGLVAGIMCYAIINTSTWVLGAISGGRWLPPDYENKEYWSFRSDSPGAQPWFIRALKGDKRFWKPESLSFELQSQEAIPKS